MRDGHEISRADWCESPLILVVETLGEGLCLEPVRVVDLAVGVDF